MYASWRINKIEKNKMVKALVWRFLTILFFQFCSFLSIQIHEACMTFFLLIPQHNKMVPFGEGLRKHISINYILEQKRMMISQKRLHFFSCAYVRFGVNTFGVNTPPSSYVFVRIWLYPLPSLFQT